MAPISPGTGENISTEVISYVCISIPARTEQLSFNSALKGTLLAKQQWM